ncbi:MAG TPA: flagellar hook-length control protein FliK [Rhizomicrobium sp.]|nr:flagellar hook-length control protein FliK [Rhizomicrobium sp.]
MTSVAANIVTNGQHANGVSRGASDPAQGDDGFAAMLGGAMHVRSDLGKSTQPVTPRDGDADATAPDGDKASDAASRALTRLQAFQQAWSSDGPPTLTRASDLGRTTTTSGKDAAKNSATDPAQSTDDGKPVKAPDVTATNPILAQMVAAQQPAQGAAAPTAASAATDDDQDDVTAPTAAAMVTDPTTVATQAFAAATATDKTAASMLANGSTAKPAKPGATDAKAASDDQKTQTQGSTAAALADTANAARVFTDKQASSAHALPLHAGADTPKNGNQSGGSSTGQQSNGNQPNNAAAAAPATPAAANTPAVAPTFTPTHVQQAAPQPDASAVAANTSITPTAATQTGGATPAQPATQLQVSHPAAAAPDINTLAFNIATKSEGGARHFDIRLDPAELGRVDVRLTVDDAGKAQASLSVEKPQTLELLQKDSTHLERALKDAGLDLSQNGLNFSLKGQQQQAGNNGGGQSGFGQRGRTLAVQAIAAADTAATNLSLSGVASGDSRLDIRV